MQKLLVQYLDDLNFQEVIDPFMKLIEPLKEKVTQDLKHLKITDNLFFLIRRTFCNLIEFDFIHYEQYLWKT